MNCPSCSFTRLFKQSTVVGDYTMKTTFDFNFDLYQAVKNSMDTHKDRSQLKKLLFDYTCKLVIR